MKKDTAIRLSLLKPGQSFQFITPEIGMEGEFTALDLKVWLVLNHTASTVIYTSREGGIHIAQRDRLVDFIDMSKYRTDLTDQALQLLIRIYNIKRHTQSMITTCIDTMLRRSDFSIEKAALFLEELSQQLVKDASESTEMFLGANLSRDIIEWVNQYEKDKN